MDFSTFKTCFGNKKKNTNKRMTKQIKDQQKIFANLIYRKHLYPEYVNNSQHLTVRKMNK